MGEARKILLVEDDKNDRLFFSVAIRRIGTRASFHSVEDGQQAIDFLEGKGQFADRKEYPLPDIIVLDLRMPNVNGFEFLAWRSTSHFSSLPVIVLEGGLDKEEQQRARAMGAIRTFSKPGDLESLVQIVKEIAAFDPTQLRCDCRGEFE